MCVFVRVCVYVCFYVCVYRMDKEFIVTHIYATIWLTGHLTSIIGICFLCTRRWENLFLWLFSLYLFSNMTFAKNEKVINFFQPIFQRGFNGIRIIHESPLLGESRTMYCFHPHAIVANGFGVAMHDLEQRGIRVAVAAARTLCAFNPAFRWFVNSYGCDLISVDSVHLTRALQAGKPVALCPGGFEEVMLMKPQKDVVYLSHRKGFVKYAIKFGYSLVPIFAFGESDLYENAFPLPETVKRKCAQYGFPIVVPHGSSWWNFAPCKPEKGMLIVFGQAIHVTQSSSPTSEQINTIHTKYIEAISVLYQKHNPYNRQLLIL